MKMITNIATLILIAFTPAAFADFANIKCLSPEETAEELLNIEASGRQHLESTCMQQENFPRYRIGTRSSGGGDAPDTRKPVILSGKEPFKIKSISKNPDDSYTVKFEYKPENGKPIKDTLEFVEYKQGELKSLFGCAAITSAPKTLAVHRSCLPK
jgi:hypothetical protein